MALGEWIQIPIPPSANKIWLKNRGKGFRLSQDYQEFLEDAIPIYQRKLLGITTFPLQLSIEVVGGKGWIASRDLDNIVKPTLDSIKRAGCIPDDKTEYISVLKLEYLEPAKPKQKAVCRIRLDLV